MPTFGLQARLILAAVVALALLGLYIKGRMDQSGIAKGKQLEKTVKDYETDRSTKARIRDADFNAVLDLNDRMYKRTK